MSLFSASAPPRVFALPPGADFAAALVAGLEARLGGQPPEAMARVEIWLNTQRARRAVQAALQAGPARLLPRLRVVTELGLDPLAALDLPAPVPELRRKLELARLVAALLAAEPGLAPETAAFDLADSLAALLDEMQGEGVDPAALATLDVSGHAAHWQRSLGFLSILKDYAATLGSPEGRMRAVAEALAASWAVAPPDHPVLVAGSTGSRGATRAFMAAVARLPQGAVILPGYDATLPPEVWARLGATDPGAADHPGYGVRRLADALGFDPARVPAWRDVAPPCPPRNHLVALALRPAPVTGQWRSEGTRLTPELGAATAALTWVEAESPRAEARAIALALRGAAERGLRAALVTPDRELARRVTAELGRWDLRPDDSAGRPLALTPPGVLLRRLAALQGARLTPEALLTLLKHPLVASAPGARRAHRLHVAALERDLLRGGPPALDDADLTAWAARAGGDAPVWGTWLCRMLDPLRDDACAPLAQHVARHRAAAEGLAAGPGADRGHGLWERGAGEAAQTLLDALAAEADAGGPFLPRDYRALLQSLLATRDVPEDAVVSHPGIMIWGTLEARVQAADLVILGGLNEGVWPRLPAPDPWLSRDLRRALGLPSAERQIGLSAHDFQQAMAAAEVIVSRATRDAEAPTIASRWLLRLENLLGGLGEPGMAALTAAKARGELLLAQAAALDRPVALVPPARRPAPRPPAAARPPELSVTRIERLVRDPYDIYAQKVLRLRPLEPLGRVPDALERGMALHAALEAFGAATAEGLPDDPHVVFERAARESLAAVPWPAVRAIWTARLMRAAGWFLEGEIERRNRAAPFAREARGRRALTGLAQPFAVTARADRIDRTQTGGYAIYDYKSGGVPSEKEALAFHLQLPLEAAIAAIGGFEGVPQGRAEHLELIGLGSRKNLALDRSPGAVADVLARLHRLIAFYQDPANGFVARLRPQKLGDQGDYDHLARRGEWADGDPPAPQDVP